MSASLSVGQGSLLLNINAPLESDGVTLRDDVIGAKVWVSTLATFNPANNEGTLVYDGNSLIVSIPGLTPGTTYYVRYAIISEIDPNVYTVSTTYSGIPRGEAQVVDISGYTNFVQHVDGSFTPANAAIVGTTSNIINPQFTWSITGGNLSANTGQSVVVTPTSGSSGIVLTLSVNGSNVVSPIEKTVRLSVVYDGQTGQTGSPGSKVAYPSIYKWTADAAPPTRPSAATPALKYTWATAEVGVPEGWSSAAPSNDTPGSYLWQITIPLSATGTSTQSDLLWDSASYPIRAIGYNGANGAKGDKGATGDTGGPGAKGDTGNPGSASFVIDRGASDTSTAPTAQEVLDTIGRAPVAGDMAIVSYSNNAGAKNYKYITSWVLFNTYISGSLIVENTITGDRLVANTITASKIDSRGLSIKDASGNIILSAGVPLEASNINAATNWVNTNISIASDGTLNNAGGGKVTIGGLGYTGDLNATYGAQAGVNLKDSAGATLSDDAVKSNLINLDWWKRGAVIPWSQNAEYNEILSIAPSNADLVGLGPRGGNDLVWYCVENSGDGQSGGGWNANISSTLNPAKTYRFVVPIRISGTQTNGYAYWGTNGVCNLNTTTENTNPYFAVADRTALANDRWYLFVGYVFPYGSTNNTNDSAGIWDCKTGLKVQGGTNYCHTQTGVTGHRAYQYYANILSKQFFGRPMINVVDGAEPSLREYFESTALLNNSITIDGTGALQGVGTGAGTVVSNAKVTVDANGALQGIGTADVVVNNAKVNVDTDGKLQGIGTGAGTVVSNAKVTVDANGALQGIGTADVVVNNAKVNVDTDGKLQGIGTGAGTVVSNAKVTVDANGILQGTGTADVVVNNAKVTVDATTGALQGIGTADVVVNNAKVTVDATTGALQGIGTGAGTVVSNAKVTVDANGILQGTGTADVVVNNAKVNVDTDGKLQGIGTGAGTTVSNAKVTVDANGTLQGIGTGAGTTVSNAKVTVDANGALQGIGTGAGTTVNNASIGLILNPNGTLTATGGPVASGGVTAGGLGALSKSSADILSSTISINAVTGAGFRAGDLQWNASGVRTSGKGVAMTPGGLLGVNADGVTTFAIDAATGEASFAGSTTVGQITTATTEVGTNWKAKDIGGIGSNYTWLDAAYATYSGTKVAVIIGKAISTVDIIPVCYRSVDGGTSWSVTTTAAWGQWVNVTMSCVGSDIIVAGWEPISGSTDHLLKIVKGVMTSINVISWSAPVTLGSATPIGNVTIVWPKPTLIGSGKWIIQSVTGLYISTDSGTNWSGVTNAGSGVLTIKGPTTYNSAANTVAFTDLSGNTFQTGTVGSGTTITWNASVNIGSVGSTWIGDTVWTGTRYLVSEGKYVRYSSDGVNWTSATVSRSLRKIRAITSNIILGVSDSDGGLLRSSDGGLTWTDYSPAISSSTGIYLLGVAADDTNPIVVGNKNTLLIDTPVQVPTGQGTVIDKAGKFYTGNSNSNIYFDGSTLNLQVPFLQSKNIINTDISTKEYYNAITAGPVNVYGSITVPTSSTLTIV